MILLISTCSEKLSEEEFVKPIADILDAAKAKHRIIQYLDIGNDKHSLDGYDGIIICGTALFDNKYIDELQYFSWLKSYEKPVLGICSGLQIICLIFSAGLIKSKEIGMTQIKVKKQNSLIKEDIEAFELHGNSVIVDGKFEVLADSKKSVQAVKHKIKPFYGIMFHPEVRNSGVIMNFLSLVK